jgi:serine/threonine protein kinase
MAKVYGGRWQIIGQLGQGGQSEVFRVFDKSKEYEGEFALKRILNNGRLKRFEREVDAVGRLNHVNIIKILDHSLGENGSKGSDKHYLVMPIASGGDLGSLGRVKLYQGSVDSVVNVATQVAHALNTAHAAGIIHRDVKPQNILSTGEGHKIWLSDFGICHLNDESKITEIGEVVGPRCFIAPEIESGIEGNISAACDIYSLGKVIYYLFSGGILLPRESLYEQSHDGIFSGSEHSQLLLALLSKMVCLQPHRLQSIDQVLSELELLKDWENKASILPVSLQTLSSLQSLKINEANSSRIISQNQQARINEKERSKAVSNNFLEWMKENVEQFSKIIQSDGFDCKIAWALNCTIKKRDFNNGTSVYESIDGVKFSLVKSTQPAVMHILKLYICEPSGYYENLYKPSEGGIVEITERDPLLAFIPVYTKRENNLMGEPPSHFFSKPESIGKVIPRLDKFLVHGLPASGIAVRGKDYNDEYFKRFSSYFWSEHSIHSIFKASEWPTNTTTVNSIMDQVWQTFFDLVSSH